MNPYLLVIKLQLQDIAEYRLDFIIHLVKYAVMVILMALVWLAVDAEGSLGIDRGETIRYFFFAAMLYSLSNFHTWYIEEDIKLGGLSKYLLKPIEPHGYYLSKEIAAAVTELFLKVIIMLPILFALGFNFAIPFAAFGLFLLFLPLIFMFAFNLLTSISYLAFWLNDVFAIRWSLMIVFRFLSGVLVPISFFPLVLQDLFWYLQFQHLAYTPIQLIQQNYSVSTGATGLGILLLWTVGIVQARKFIWNTGVAQYEGTGI